MFLGRQKVRSGGKLSLMTTAKGRPKDDAKAASGRKKVPKRAKKVGRPRAKHSSPDYKQMSVYVHKDVRNRVKALLFEQEGEFSALVETLLREWLDKQVSR